MLVLLLLTASTVGAHRLRRMVSERCSGDADCGSGLLSCDLELKICKCTDTFSVLSTSGQCLPVRQLGEACLEHAQCRVLERNASCEGQSCVCDSGFYLLHQNNGSLCKQGEEFAPSGVDIKMIVILSVMVIMFFGICVALHLFSKARFRNRRTIFNTPHPGLLHKLSKRRKSSVQHLPPPFMGRRHHSFSGQNSDSLMPLQRVPKTRSHECLREAVNRESSPRIEIRPKTAPLAEKESLQSSDELDKKTPEMLRNGSLIKEEEEQRPPASPKVIITDADGAHTVVTVASSDKVQL